MQACTASSAEELRVYRLAAEIRDRHDDLLRQVTVTRGRAERQSALLVLSGWLVFAAGYLGGVLISVQAALRGHGSVGQVMLTVTLGAQLLGGVFGLVSLGQWLQQAMRAVGYYLWLVDRTKTVTPPPAALPPARAAFSAERGLVLDHVSFAYPGTQTPILRDVSLHLPPGATVAIVGENGAGKTTLIKLLYQMYAPSSGTIRFDGQDIAALDPEATRRSSRCGCRRTSWSTRAVCSPQSSRRQTMRSTSTCAC
ncbi:MAG TPA: ABC transporter ATP-binding protein/permease [Streptosporangiaceae bacterium]|nr:ABC transporter ATP-binding protein/permease [Streptosporangiaceae bacterium]